MFVCPGCDPGRAAGYGVSPAWCHNHAGLLPCADCGALSGDQHYVGCPQKPPLPPFPAAGDNLGRWILRHMAERRREER